MESTLKRQTESLSKIDMTSKDTLEVLSVLPSIINDYPLQSDFRVLLKKRSLFFYRSIIDTLGPISEQISSIQSTNSGIKSRLESLQEEVHSSLSLTSQALRSTSRLSQELSRISSKKQILESLLSKLKLSTAEEETLKDSPVGLSESFFEVLAKLQAISDYALLLDTNESRVLKLSVDDYVSSYSEIAYEKLFRFVQEQCKILQRDSVELLPGFSQAISSLKQRPIYYSHCRDELVKSRSRFFIRSFRNTLTSGPEALEKHVGKPVLFIGECLAWIQSTVLNEKELIEGLLGSIETLKSEGDNIQESTVLDKITDSSCIDLKDYIEIAIKNCGMVQSFQILALFSYYIKSFTEKDLLSFASSIVQTLYKSSTLTENKLNTAVEQALAQIKLFSISTDLKVPRVFTEKFKEFVTILDLILENPQFLQFYKSIYEVLIDSTLEFYIQEAQAALEKNRMSILVLNFLVFVKSSLYHYDFTAGEIDQIEYQVTVHKETLIEECVANIASSYNLSTNYLPRCLKNFHDDLQATGGLDVSILDMLNNENFKRSIHNAVGERILILYTTLKEQTSEETPSVEEVELIIKC